MAYLSQNTVMFYLCVCVCFCLLSTAPRQGQVLRLRKTDVGSNTSREDLILRAKKDEEFFKNVARPFLSPLLTDESHLVIVEPAALMAFKETVEARRPGQRARLVV